MRALVLGILAVAATSPLAAAQESPPPSDGASIVLRGVPAGTALAEVAETAGVSVVFDPTLPGLDRPVWCDGRDIAVLLRCITSAAGLDVVLRSSGTYLVVVPAVEAPAVGGITGVVVDAETRAPLPGAHVRLVGTATGTTTDEVGVFAVGWLQPGTYALAVSYVGYAPAQVETLVEPSGDARTRIELRAETIRGRPVVVEGLQAPLPSARLGAEASASMASAPGSGTSAGLGTTTGSTLATEPNAPSFAARAPRRTMDAVAPGPGALGVVGRSVLDGLSIQGADDGDHPLRLDGATVYEPVAFGTLVGALSPLAVGQATIRKAGFGVEHGSSLAGVVEVEHATTPPHSSRPVDATVNLDPLAAGVRVRHDARVRGARVTTALTGRRSLWDVMRTPALDAAVRQWNAVDPVLTARFIDTRALRFETDREGSDLRFSDLHLASRVTLDDLRTIRVSAYRGQSIVETDLLAGGSNGRGLPPAAILARDGTRWSNSAASLRYDAVVSARWTLRTALTASAYQLDVTRASATGDVPPGQTIESVGTQLATMLDREPASADANRIREATLSTVFDVRRGPAHVTQIGAEVTGVAHHLTLAIAPVRTVGTSGASARVAAFVADRRLLAGRWTVEPGLRMTVLPSTGLLTAEPRASLRFDALPGDRLAGLSLRGIAARLAVGVYRQFVTRHEFATFGPSAIVPEVALWLPAEAAPPVALHVASEGLWQSPRGTAVRVEGYIRSTPRLYVLDYNALLVPDLSPTDDLSEILQDGQSLALGAGIRVEHDGTRATWSVGGSVSRSRQQVDDRFDGRWVPAPWDDPLRLDAALGLVLSGQRGAGLVFRARATASAGRTWAFRRAYYDVLPTFSGRTSIGPVRLDRPEDDRLPGVLRLDISLAYAGVIRGLGVEAAFDVVNVTNRRAPLDWSLVQQATGVFSVRTRALPGIEPSARLRFSF
ncbi:MAG: carboxypeptidase-like regulatory domain-containing protein [Bacteroidota bacterium]